MARKYKSVPFSCTKELENEINKRAASLGISRSAYIQILIRKDLGLSNAIEIIPRKK